MSGQDHTETLRAHGYHRLTVKRVVRETGDANSYVLDIPAELRETYRYQPGQFCTFRVHLGGEEFLRSYSMSSAPETDEDLTVTVKRVPEGMVSNWFLDRVASGDVLEATRPAGVFCLRDSDEPIVAFCGGSGITPVMSIAKSALVSTGRPVHLVYANRDPDSVIFHKSLEELAGAHPGRLEVLHHFDSERGFLDRAAVTRLAGDRLGADFYICGPSAFMDLVESTLLELGVEPGSIFIERFAVPGEPAMRVADDEAPAAGTGGEEFPEKVTVIMKGKRTEVTYQKGDTLLETARRGALQPPFSCEAGNCATCMAILRKGTARMRVNNALTPEEVEEGWVLTCQAIPTSAELTVEYEAF